VTRSINPTGTGHPGVINAEIGMNNIHMEQEKRKNAKARDADRPWKLRIAATGSQFGVLMSGQMVNQQTTPVRPRSQDNASLLDGRPV
jgi:hypothetical protein